MLNVLSYRNPAPIAGALNIWQHQLDRNPELVESMLKHKGGKSANRFARKLTIVEPSNNEAREFLERNHLSGATRSSSFKYGLSDGAQLLFLVTLGKPRYTKSFSLEVLRLASKQGFSVVGGASKIFAHILKQHPNDSILSYSDMLLGDGGVYQNARFRQLGVTKPGYFWEKDGVILHRHQTMKHHLPKLLGENIDLTLSERTLLVSNDWWQVKDLGHLRWGIGSPSLEDIAQKKFNFTYKITRPNIDEAFYIGVHSTDNMNDGYLGSGQRIVASQLKYGKTEHHREILQYFSCRQQLMHAEAELVTYEVLANPNCLNISLGGGSPLMPNGSTTGRTSIWHPSGTEKRIEKSELDIFLERGWLIGRHPSNKINLHGKWFKRSDGTVGRTTGDIPVDATLGKNASTAGRTWVTRDGKQQLVSTCYSSDTIKFSQTKTNKGGKMLEKNGIRRIFFGVEADSAIGEGWAKPPPSTLGKIGMSSPTGEKKLVNPLDARKLALQGWTLSNKQLKSAPPQVLELAAEMGLKLPRKRK